MFPLKKIKSGTTVKVLKYIAFQMSYKNEKAELFTTHKYHLSAVTRRKLVFSKGLWGGNRGNYL